MKNLEIIEMNLTAIESASKYIKELSSKEFDKNWEKKTEANSPALCNLYGKLEAKARQIDASVFSARNAIESIKELEDA